MLSPKLDDVAFPFGEFRKVPFCNLCFRPCNAFHKDMNGHDEIEPSQVDENSSVLDGVFGNFVAVSRQSLSHIHSPLLLKTTEQFGIRENPENKGNTLIWVIDQRIAEVRRATGTVSKRAAVALTTQVAA